MMQLLKIIIENKELFISLSVMSALFIELTTRFESLKLSFLTERESVIRLLQEKVSAYERSEGDLVLKIDLLKDSLYALEHKEPSSIFYPLVYCYKQLYYLPEQSKNYICLFILAIVGLFFLSYWWHSPIYHKWLLWGATSIQSGVSFLSIKLMGSPKKTVDEKLDELALAVGSISTELNAIVPNIAGVANSLPDVLSAQNSVLLTFIGESNKVILNNLSVNDLLMKDFLNELTSHSIKLTEVQSHVLIESIGSIIQGTSHSSTDLLREGLTDVVTLLSSASSTNTVAILNQLANCSAVEDLPSIIGSTAKSSLALIQSGCAPTSLSYSPDKLSSFTNSSKADLLLSSQSGNANLSTCASESTLEAVTNSSLSSSLISVESNTQEAVVAFNNFDIIAFLNTL
jgi:hypothetical protein